MVTLEPEPLLRLRALVRNRRTPPQVTSLPGGLVVRAKGRGLETADLRAFAYGDDPRHIDRNATARTGQPQIRTFHAERDSTTLLVADFRPSMLWGTRRTLRSIAAAEALSVIGWQAIHTGGRVGLIAVTGGETVYQAAAGRDRGMVAVIGAMVQAHARALGHAADPDPPLSDALARARRVAPRGAQVALATALDHPGEEFADRVAALQRRTALSVIRIADAFETEAPRGVFRYQTADGRAGAAPAHALAPEDPAGLITATYRTHLAPDAQEHQLHG
ncbi:MAG: DUF58 domain-containing protein [Pseudomonadota bacterium]